MKTAAGRRASGGLDGVEVEARLVERHADDLDPAVLEQVEQGREPRVLDEHEVTRAQQGAADEVEGVHGAVDDEEVVGGIRPVAGQLVAQLVEHRVVEVAARRRRVGQAGSTGTSGGSSVLSGMPVERSRLTGDSCRSARV